jgi:hypothetical protein
MGLILGGRGSHARGRWLWLAVKLRSTWRADRCQTQRLFSAGFRACRPRSSMLVLHWIDVDWRGCFVASQIRQHGWLHRAGRIAKKPLQSSLALRSGGPVCVRRILCGDIPIHARSLRLTRFLVSQGRDSRILPDC